MSDFQLEHPIRVVGVGGGGCNAVDRMIQVGVAGVDFAALNTDVQALHGSESRNRLALGPRVARGLGAGANAELGQRAAHESRAALEQLCQGAELCFVAAGLGGGTGSGAAPLVARSARQAGSTVVAVVTMPFSFEGTRRRQQAEQALAALRDEADTTVVVHNDLLLTLLDPQHACMDIALRVADECLRQAIEGLTGLIYQPGLVNLDFADVKSVLRNGGLGHLAIGFGVGERAIAQAMRHALSSPLLGRGGVEGASAVLVNVRGHQLPLHQMAEAMASVQERVDPAANIFFGTVVDATMGERVEVTLMAVGLERPVPLAEVIPGAPPIVTPPAPRPAAPRPATVAALLAREERLPLDDLSIPAFLRRRQRRAVG